MPVADVRGAPPLYGGAGTCTSRTANPLARSAAISLSARLRWGNVPATTATRGDRSFPAGGVAGRVGAGEGAAGGAPGRAVSPPGRGLDEAVGAAGAGFGAGAGEGAGAPGAAPAPGVSAAAGAAMLAFCPLIPRL